MRNFIIGLSILFFTLSGVVAFKAFEIHSNTNRYHNNPENSRSKEVLPKTEDVSGQLNREQSANRVLVEDSQTTIGRVEDKPSKSNEKPQSNFEAEGPLKKPRVIGVLSGGQYFRGQHVNNKKLLKGVDECVPHFLTFTEHHIIIEGHTDNRPIKRPSGMRYMDNMELSFSRAKAVAMILEKKGITLDRISVVGYGDTHPADSNETSEGRANNRRVEIKLIPGDREL
jgi:outer membrane protein OmpA-like peptidoglycan-associated protein